MQDHEYVEHKIYKFQLASCISIYNFKDTKGQNL